MKTKKLILLITIILVVVSCGTRKSEVNKTDVKEVAKVEQTTKETTTENKELNENVKVEKNIEVNKENNVVTEIETITPVDATKKSIYKGKEFVNAKIENRKTTDLSKENLKYKLDYLKTKKELQNAKKELDLYKKMYNEMKSSVKDKKVVSEKDNFWNWIILIILILAFLYFVYRSRKIVKDKENY